MKQETNVPSPAPASEDGLLAVPGVSVHPPQLTLNSWWAAERKVGNSLGC